MTRKDYILFAEVFYRHKKRYGFRTDAVVDEVIEDISDALASDNPRFNRERFITACNEGA